MIMEYKFHRTTRKGRNIQRRQWFQVSPHSLPLAIRQKPRSPDANHEVDLSMDWNSVVSSQAHRRNMFVETRKTHQIFLNWISFWAEELAPCIHRRSLVEPAMLEPQISIEQGHGSAPHQDCEPSLNTISIIIHCINALLDSTNFRIFHERFCVVSLVISRTHVPPAGVVFEGESCKAFRRIHVGGEKNMSSIPEIDV